MVTTVVTYFLKIPSGTSNYIGLSQWRKQTLKIKLERTLLESVVIL